MREKMTTAAPLLLFAALVAVFWQFGPGLLDIPPYVIPKLSDVFLSLGEHAQLLGRHFVVTLKEAILGLAISVFFGTLIAAVVENSQLARRTMYPLLIASQTVPIIALSPLMVMWFGYELWSKVAVVVLFTIFPIAVNTADGFRSADPVIGEWMRAMGAGKRALLLKWKLPSALPGFWTGLKLAAAFSVGGATLGEWLGGERGLGVYTKRASNLLRADAVFAGVLLLSLMGIGLFGAVVLLERISLAGRHAAGTATEKKRKRETIEKGSAPR